MRSRFCMGDAAPRANLVKSVLQGLCSRGFGRILFCQLKERKKVELEKESR